MPACYCCWLSFPPSFFFLCFFKHRRTTSFLIAPVSLFERCFRYVLYALAVLFLVDYKFNHPVSNSVVVSTFFCAYLVFIYYIVIKFVMECSSAALRTLSLIFVTLTFINTIYYHCKYSDYFFSFIISF